MASFLYTICFFHRNPLWISAGLQCILLVGASGIYAVLRPYKSNFRNNIDYLVLTLLEIFSAVVVLAVVYIGSSFNLVKYVLVTALLLGAPHMILILYICYVLATKAGITQWFKRKYETLRKCMQATIHAQNDIEAESDTDSLPDRLINPGEYEPVLPTTEENTTAESTDHDNEDPRRLTPVYIYTYGSIS